MLGDGQLELSTYAENADASQVRTQFVVDEFRRRVGD